MSGIELTQPSVVRRTADESFAEFVHAREQGQIPAAMRALEETLDLDPKHVGALRCVDAVFCAKCAQHVDWRGLSAFERKRFWDGQCPKCAVAIDFRDSTPRAAQPQNVTAPTAAPRQLYEVKEIGVGPLDSYGVLLEAATPELYRMNAFRVLELPTDATAREISRHAEMLRMSEKYGNGNGAVRRTGPMALSPSPEEGTLRTAIQRLHDPEQRLMDEFFWFWPAQLGQGKTDESLRSLASGNVKAATEAWSNAERNSSESNVSMHNIAVLSHATALDFEFASRSRRLNGADTEGRDLAWRNAFSRWRILLGYEGFWSRLTARIRELSDPRLTTGTARRFRASLPLALLSINAQLAVRAAEQDDKPEAERHVRIIRDSGFPTDVVDEALRRAVAPVRLRIKAMCEAAQGKAHDDPERADQVTRTLLNQTRPLLRVMDCVLGAGNLTRGAVYDETATALLVCQVAFGNKTENWDESLELLKLARPLANSHAVVVRIEDNIRIVQNNLKYQQDYRDYVQCAFCGRNRGDPKAFAPVPMHGEVQRFPIPNGWRTTWKKYTVEVPRCAACRKVHRKQVACVVLTLLAAMLLGALIAGAYTAIQAYFRPKPWFGPRTAWQEAAWGGAFMALIPGLIAGSVWSLIYRIRKGVKAAGSKTKHKIVKDLMQKGWKIGEKPT